ncbi:MAG: c-type cytochrome [Castellaniella sp.]|nr:c-type cytochrome [Castellaniella sp.]
MKLISLSIWAVSALACGSALAQQAQPAQAVEAKTTAAPQFTPPPADAIPEGPFGDAVRRGQDIFLHTGKFASQYVGNSLNCASCHMDAGRQPGASPMWAAYVLYPAYRAKNGHVNTLAERLQGCFQFSMNGKMPAADSQTIVDLESYMYWMAKGAPTGVKLAGQGFPALPKPAQEPDYVRGQKVFEQHCALCHGAQGQGQHDATGRMVFPALWGDDSFNWGAGMHSVSTAAAFIHANMPLSRGGTLTEQESWDVAYYMDGHDRPQDPRYAGDLQATIKEHHGGKNDLYGREINGKVLGADSPPAGGRLTGHAPAKSTQ